MSATETATRRTQDILRELRNDGSMKVINVSTWCSIREDKAKQRLIELEYASERTEFSNYVTGLLSQIGQFSINMTTRRIKIVTIKPL